MSKVKKRRGHRKASAWSLGLAYNAEGLTLRDVARASLAKINSGRKHLPRCGAHARSTGEPCKAFAMANGRCAQHGGKTPRHDQWHVRQTPSGKGKRDIEKYERKLKKAEKEEAARRLRLLRATEAEREAYKKWLWSRPPGSAVRRAARRLDQRIRRQEALVPKIAEIMVGDAETQAMMARLEELKARRAELESWISGVFS